MDNLDKHLFAGNLKKILFLIKFFFSFEPWKDAKLWIGFVLISVMTFFTTSTLLFAVSSLMGDDLENGLFWAVISIVALVISSKFRIPLKAAAGRSVLLILKGEECSYFKVYNSLRKELKETKMLPGEAVWWEYDIFAGKWLKGALGGGFESKIFNKHFEGLSAIAPAIGRYILAALTYADKDLTSEEIYKRIEEIDGKLPLKYRLKYVLEDSDSDDEMNDTDTDILMSDEDEYYYDEFFDLQIGKSYMAIVFLSLVLFGLINVLLLPKFYSLIIFGFGLGIIGSRAFKNLIDYIVHIYFFILYLKVYHSDELKEECLLAVKPFLDADLDFDEDEDLDDDVTDLDEDEESVATKITDINILEDKERYEALTREIEKDKTGFTILEEDEGEDVSESEESEESESLTKKIELIGSEFNRVNSVYKAFKVNTDKGHNFTTIQRFLVKKGFSDDEITLGKELMSENENAFREFKFEGDVSDQPKILKKGAKGSLKDIEKREKSAGSSSSEGLKKIIAFIILNIEKGNSKEMIIKFLRSKKYARVRIEEAFDLITKEKGDDYLDGKE